jgi:hypothetical protein
MSLDNEIRYWNISGWANMYAVRLHHCDDRCRDYLPEYITPSTRTASILALRRVSGVKRLEIFKLTTEQWIHQQQSKSSTTNYCIRLMRVDRYSSYVTKVTPRSDMFQNARVGGAPFASSIIHTSTLLSDKMLPCTLRLKMSAAKNKTIENLTPKRESNTYWQWLLTKKAWSRASWRDWSRTRWRNRGIPRCLGKSLTTPACSIAQISYD